MKFSAPPLQEPVLPASGSSGDTRQALLNAAEQLFSQQGVEGTSVRQITRQAGANLGAINYHFGTKDRLAIEVYARRLQPINRERLARLDALEQRAGRRKLRLEDIVEAVIRPAVEAEENSSACDDLMQLMSRCLQEPNEEVKKFVEQQFAEVVQRFDEAILRALPELPPGELFWRMAFLLGALHHGQAKWVQYDQVPHPSKHDTARPSREGFIQRIITFAVAGLKAPLPQGS